MVDGCTLVVTTLVSVWLVGGVSIVVGVVSGCISMTSSNRDVDMGVVEGCCTRSTGPVGVAFEEKSRSYTIVIKQI